MEGEREGRGGRGGEAVSCCWWSWQRDGNHCRTRRISSHLNGEEGGQEVEEEEEEEEVEEEEEEKTRQKGG